MHTFCPVEPKPFLVDERVRWSDVDKAGIVFYGAYVRFFELSEMELFREAGLPYSEVFDRFNIWLPRVHLECDFRYPARLDDALRVGAYFTCLGTSSITINFDILHIEAGRLAAVGHEVLVCVGRETMRPKPLPAELRTFLEPFTLTKAESRAYLGATRLNPDATDPHRHEGLS